MKFRCPHKPERKHFVGKEIRENILCDLFVIENPTYDICNQVCENETCEISECKYNNPELEGNVKYVHGHFWEQTLEGDEYIQKHKPKTPEEIPIQLPDNYEEEVEKTYEAAMDLLFVKNKVMMTGINSKGEKMYKLTPNREN